GRRLRDEAHVPGTGRYLGPLGRDGGWVCDRPAGEWLGEIPRRRSLALFRQSRGPEPLAPRRAATLKRSAAAVPYLKPIAARPNHQRWSRGLGRGTSLFVKEFHAPSVRHLG